MWDVFMDQFEVLATQAPVMLVAGNHERDFPDSGDRYGTNIDSGNILAATLMQGAISQCKLQSAQRHQCSFFLCCVKVQAFIELQLCVMYNPHAEVRKCVSSLCILHICLFNSLQLLAATNKPLQLQQCVDSKLP